MACKRETLSKGWPRKRAVGSFSILLQVGELYAYYREQHFCDRDEFGHFFKPSIISTALSVYILVRLIER